MERQGRFVRVFGASDVMCVALADARPGARTKRAIVTRAPRNRLELDLVGVFGVLRLPLHSLKVQESINLSHLSLPYRYHS